MGYGTVTLVLFFAMVVVLNVGISEMNVEAYNITEEYKGNITGVTSKGHYTSVIDQFINPALLGATAVIAGIVYVLSGNIGIAIAAAAMGAFANFFLIPISSVSALGLPFPLDWFIVGFMNLLILVSIISFVRGRDL